MIDAMIAAGLTREQMAALLKHELAKQEQAKAEKRAADAQRQRKSRMSRMSRNVTVTACDKDGHSVTEPAPYTEDARTYAEPEPTNTTNKGKNVILTDNSKVCSARRHADWPEDYADQLWEIYPRKTEKKAGMDALARLHRSDRVSWLEIVNGVECLFGCDPQFVPALGRWIKGERWKDERLPQPRAGPSRQASNRRGLVDALHRMIPDEPPPEPQFPRLAFGG